MATIKEDYVSFETAKLLKIKGFKGEFHKHYWGYENGKEFLTESSFNPEYDYPAPTLQMAIKWLRETHNFNVNTELTVHGYFCSLSHIVRDLSGHIIDIEDSEAWETAYHDSYKQAIEAAIKYCLENLIK